MKFTNQLQDQQLEPTERETFFSKRRNLNDDSEIFIGSIVELYNLIAEAGGVFKIDQQKYRLDLNEESNGRKYLKSNVVSNNDDSDLFFQNQISRYSSKDTAHLNGPNELSSDSDNKIFAPMIKINVGTSDLEDKSHS